MTMKINSLTGAIGADISGLDLSDVDDDAGAVLRAALDEHLVIRVRKQSLDRFQLSDLARTFGPPFLHPLVQNGFDDCPDVLELVREASDATLFGGESWHTDISWLKPAGYASILHALEIPPVGGDTSFASTIAAFAALSSSFQDMLRDLSAVHAYHWSENREVPPWVVEQPVVRRHPVTQQEGLYVNRMFTTRFTGMTTSESAPLLAQLFDLMEQHQFTCRFRWQVGDVLIWDNRFCLHYPISDFTGHRRRMIRTSTMETVE